MKPETDLSVPLPLVACTISRDVHLFDLLIEDMEAALGPAWGDLTFLDAAIFLDQPAAADLRFVVLAMDSRDEAELSDLLTLTRLAKKQGLGVILVADNVAPVSLHQLLREGVDEFIPYPLPEGDLATAIARLSDRAITTAARMAKVIAVQGMAGGVGASTIAVNLADRIAHGGKRVCVLDLDIHFGSVGGYLSLPPSGAWLDSTADTLPMFLQSAAERLDALTAPAQISALDARTPAFVEELITATAGSYDVVIIDLPFGLSDWSETVFALADTILTVSGISGRCRKNAFQFNALLDAIAPKAKTVPVLNRAPHFFDRRGKTALAEMENRLPQPFAARLADGGRKVATACDSGRPLRLAAPRSSLTRDIGRLATLVMA